MKKMIALTLTLMLCAGLLAGCADRTPSAPDKPDETAPSETATGETTPHENTPSEPAENLDAAEDAVFGGDKFVGQWSDEYSQRVYMTVVPTERYGVYSVTIRWSNSYAKFNEWDMTASYDEASDSIKFTDGARYTVTLSEDADEVRQLQWDNSVGRFYFEDGKLRWEDGKEESDVDLRFVLLTTYAPSADVLLESFLKPIADMHSGESGSVLKRARAAYAALKFARDYVIWSNDPSELKANLAEAWGGLSAEEQTEFDENIFAVHGLVVNSAVSWDDYGYLFDDIGVSDEMQALIADNTVMEGFTRLFDSAVTVCLTDHRAEAPESESSEPATETGRQDGERFETVIALEGMEETVHYEHIVNVSAGFEMDYDYESFVRQSEEDREMFISIWDDPASPENYLEVRYDTASAELVTTDAISAILRQEYELTLESWELDATGSCVRIGASEIKGGGYTADHMQMVYIIPAPDGCRVATAHYGAEGAEGFGRRFSYMVNTMSVIEKDGPRMLTDEEALSAVRNYCFSSDPDLESIVDSEDYTVYWEIASSDESEIVVLYRSYTGAEIRYYIDRVMGSAYVTEFVPGITEEEQPTSERFFAWDHLD